MSLDAIATSGLLLALAALLCGAALWDLRHRRIPNALCGAIVALYPASFALGLAPAPWWGGAAVALAVFAVGAGLFAFGVLGGGDVKLAAATSLWAGPAYIAEFLVVMGVTGGILAVLALLRPMIPVFVFGPQVGGRLATVPYGVAIAAGGLWVIYRMFAG